MLDSGLASESSPAISPTALHTSAGWRGLLQHDMRGTEQNSNCRRVPTSSRTEQPNSKEWSALSFHKSFQGFNNYASRGHERSRAPLRPRQLDRSALRIVNKVRDMFASKPTDDKCSLQQASDASGRSLLNSARDKGIQEIGDMSEYPIDPLHILCKLVFTRR